MVRQRQGKVLRALVLFIMNVNKEINFLSKVYSKSLLKVGSLKGSPRLLTIVSRKAKSISSSNIGEYTKFLYLLNSYRNQ